MKIEVDADEAFKAVIEDLESNRKYLQWRNNGSMMVDGLVEKLSKILSAGARDYRGEAQAIAELIRGRESFLPYLEEFGVSVTI